jgi:hypothetical protein
MPTAFTTFTHVAKSAALAHPPKSTAFTNPTKSVTSFSRLHLFLTYFFEMFAVEDHTFIDEENVMDHNDDNGLDPHRVDGGKSIVDYHEKLDSELLLLSPFHSLIFFPI